LTFSGASKNKIFRKLEVCKKQVKNTKEIDNIFIERLWKSVIYQYIYLYAFKDGAQICEGIDRYLVFTIRNGLISHKIMNHLNRFTKKAA
jgi:putative transposase